MFKFSNNNAKKDKNGISSKKNAASLILEKTFFKKCGYIVIFLFAVYSSAVIFRAYKIRRPGKTYAASDAENAALQNILDSQYPIRNSLLNSLPYEIVPVKLDNVSAKSAIAIDTANGCVLYEKNADEIIPPASMTKIFSMYVVYEEIDSGRISLSDIVTLNPECWASNMPPRSSLMFLGKNHIVTVEELLIGEAICSGNDAAYALAFYVCGGMKEFVRRMNLAAKNAGLVNTHFVEASGYSALNTTTAREMAKFARLYLQKHPESLAKFHSRLSYTYPQKHNLPAEDRNLMGVQDFSQGIPDRILMPIYQKNTNPLLGLLKGCDGLKTGYIDESGYNLALTAVQNGMRILSVTMGGQGNNLAEGNAGRIKDGTEIMEWAFSVFTHYENPMLLRSYSIPLLFSNEYRINVLPAYKPKALTIPKQLAKNPEQAADEVEIKINLPEYAKAGIKAGDPIGSIEYILGGKLLQEIPLIAEKTPRQTFFLFKAADILAKNVLKL